MTPALTNYDIFDTHNILGAVNQDVLDLDIGQMLHKYYGVGVMPVDKIVYKPMKNDISKITRTEEVKFGKEPAITITYTNGRQWHQKNVLWWEVIRNKSGGYDLIYKYENKYSLTDSSKRPSYEAEHHDIVTYRTKKGDVAYITTQDKNWYGVTTTKLMEFQKMDGEK